MNLHHVAWSDSQTLEDNQCNIIKALKQWIWQKTVKQPAVSGLK